jgi:hypothetical protein
MAEALNLYDIETGLRELMDAWQEADTNEAQEAVAQAITEYMQREVSKVDGVRKFIKHCELMAQAAREEAVFQKLRAQQFERRAECTRKYCLMTLEAFHMKRAEGNSGSLSICFNGGPLPLIIDDESKIPVRFKPPVVTYPVDKQMLRAALEAGTVVPGAHLGTRGTHLEVK